MSVKYSYNGMGCDALAAVKGYEQSLEVLAEKVSVW
jgi:hypothetical protein